MQLPPFEPFPILTTLRLVLDELSANDAAFMREIIYYNGKVAADEHDAIAMITRMQTEYDDGFCISWVLRKRDDGKAIGTIGFYRGFDDLRGEVGYILKPDFREQGYMKEALQAVTSFGLSYMDLKSILAFTRPENEASRRLLHTCGFETDETVDQNGYIRYSYLD